MGKTATLWRWRHDRILLLRSFRHTIIWAIVEMSFSAREFRRVSVFESLFDSEDALSFPFFRRRVSLNSNCTENIPFSTAVDVTKDDALARKTSTLYFVRQSAVRMISPNILPVSPMYNTIKSTSFQRFSVALFCS